MTQLIQLKKPPLDCGKLEQSTSHMRNFDYRIEEGMEENLRSGKYWAAHTAWNFFGYVYFVDGVFYEDVWVYHEYQKTIGAGSLRELMDEVNSQYGAE